MQRSTRSESPADRLAWRTQPTVTDIGCVHALTKRAGVFSPDECMLAGDCIRERVRFGPSCGYFFVFAEQDGSPAGYSCFGPIPCTRNRFEIYWLVVERNRQQCGVGRALIRRTEESIRREGGVRVYVETSSRSCFGPTRAFYQRRGYRIDSVLTGYYDIADDKVIFAKNM